MYLQPGPGAAPGGAEAPEEHPESFAELMEELGFDEDKKDELVIKLEDELAKNGIEVELTDEDLTEYAKDIFGKDLKIPDALKDKMTELATEEITSEALIELSEVFKATTDPKKRATVMRKLLKETVEKSRADDSRVSKAARELIDNRKGKVEEAVDATQTEEGGEVKVDMDLLYDSMGEFGDFADIAIEQGLLDEDLVIDEIMEMIEGNENIARALLLMPIRPITAYIRTKNLIVHLKSLKEVFGNMKKRIIKRDQYVLAGLAVRKFGKAYRLWQRAMNRASYRALRVEDREKYLDAKMVASGRRWVGGGIHKAMRDLQKAKSHAERLTKKLENQAIRRAKRERGKDIRSAGREAGKDDRHDSRIAKWKQKRAIYQEELEVDSGADLIDLQSRIDYKKDLRGARTRFKTEDKADKTDWKKQKRLEKTLKKIEKLDQKIAEREAKLDARLERRSDRRRLPLKERRERNKAEKATALDAMSAQSEAKKKKEETPERGGYLLYDFRNEDYGAGRSDPETVAELKEWKRWEGLMPPEEVELMEDVQEAIYEHYLNPAFMLFVKSRDNKLDPIFRAAIGNPNALRYQKVGHGVVEVRPAPGEAVTAIEDNFLIRLEGVNITRMRNGKTDEILEAKRPKDPIPWLAAGEYNNRIDAYNEYYDTKYKEVADKYANLPGADPGGAIWETMYQEEFLDAADPLILEIYDINNGTFIGKLKAMIDARNMPFERNHPYYPIIARLASAVEAGKHEPYVLKADPARSDAYIIQERVKGELQPRVAISTTGHFLEMNPDGSVEDPDIYEDALETNYYTKTSKAMALLEPDEKKIVKDRAKAQSTYAAEAAKRYKQFLSGQTTERTALSNKRLLLEVDKQIDKNTDLDQIRQMVLIIYSSTPAEVANYGEDYLRGTLTDAIHDELRNNPEDFTSAQTAAMRAIFGL